MCDHVHGVNSRIAPGIELMTCWLRVGQWLAPTAGNHLLTDTDTIIGAHY
jgi:hypothetical protein